MKKILLFTLTALAAVVSCDKGNVTPEVRDSFVASVDYVGSKTVMGEIDAVAGTATLYWNGTEAIRVMGANDSSKEYEANVEGNALTTTFVAKPGDATLSGENYLALYPAAPAGSAIWGGDVAQPAAQMWLPNTQSLVADTYQPSTHIAVAYTPSDNKNLKFKNVSSLIKFTIGNDNVVNPVFSTNGGEYIAGNFNVYYNEGNPTVEVPEDAVSKESVVKYIGTLENGKTYYFSVLPAVLETGFTFEVQIEGKKYTKSYDERLILQRNNVLDLGTITFETETVVYKTVYFKSYDTNNKLLAWSWIPNGEGSWYTLNDENSDGIYEVSVPETMENIIFAAIPTSDAAPLSDWDNVIYKTSNLTFDGECFVMDYVGNGSWMTLAAAGTYSDDPSSYIFLKPNSNWTKDGARFAACFSKEGKYQGDDMYWVSMSQLPVKSGIYYCKKIEGYPYAILCRMNPANASNGWDTKWNQSGDLTLPTDGKNLLIAPDGWWDSFTDWSTFNPYAN